MRSGTYPPIGGDEGSRKSVYQRLSRFYASELSISTLFLQFVYLTTWKKNLSGLRVPTSNDFARRFLNLYQSISDGSSLITETLWPPIFFAMLTYDLFKYDQYPDSRYGVTVQDILLGTANNKDGPSFSSNLGENIPDENLYLLAPILMLGIWVLSMAAHVIHRRELHKIPLMAARTDYSAGQAAYLLMDDNFHPLDANDEEVSPVLEVLYKKVEDGNAWPIFRVELLSRLIKELDLDRLNKLNLNNDENYQKIRVSALKTLQQTAVFPELTARVHVFLAKFVGALYARYALWSAGETEFRIGHPVFFLVPLLKLYAKIRFFELIALKAYQYWQFEQDACDCIEQDMAWHYVEMAGTYLCTVCGDWDFVPFRDMNIPEVCVAALIAQPINGAAKATGLSRFDHSSNITSVNLGSYDWHDGASDELSVLVTALIATVGHDLRHISLEASSYIANIPDVLIEQLVRLLSVAPVQYLSLENLGLTTDQLVVLFSVLQSPLLSLDLTGMQLEDAQFSAIFNHTALLTSLLVLRLSYNLLSDFTMQQLSAIAFTSLQELALAYAQLAVDSYASVAKILSDAPLQSLDISGNTLSAEGIEFIASGITNSSLQVLSTNDMQMDDESLMLLSLAISNSSLLAWYLMNNQFSVSGVSVMMEYLKNSSLSVLSLGGNAIGNDGFVVIVSALAQTVIQQLGLEGIEFDGSGLGQLINKIIPSSFMLDLSENLLDDNALTALAKWIKRGGLLLSGLALTGIAASDQGFATLISALPDTLKQLDCSDNVFGVSSFSALLLFLQNNTQLNILRMNNIGMTSEQVTEFAVAVQNSQVSEVYLNGNLIGSQGGLDLAKHLILSGILHIASIGQPSLPRDMYHEFYQQMSPATTLQAISLNNASIGVVGATALCRVHQYLPGLEIMSLVGSGLQETHAAICMFQTMQFMPDDAVENSLALSQKCELHRDYLTLYIMISAFVSLFLGGVILTACGPKLSKLTRLFAFNQDSSPHENHAHATSCVAKQ